MPQRSTAFFLFSLVVLLSSAPATVCGIRRPKGRHTVRVNVHNRDTTTSAPTPVPDLPFVQATSHGLIYSTVNSGAPLAKWNVLPLASANETIQFVLPTSSPGNSLVFTDSNVYLKKKGDDVTSLQPFFGVNQVTPNTRAAFNSNYTQVLVVSDSNAYMCNWSPQDTLPPPGPCETLSLSFGPVSSAVLAPQEDGLIYIGSVQGLWAWSSGGAAKVSNVVEPVTGLDYRVTASGTSYLAVGTGLRLYLRERSAAGEERWYYWWTDNNIDRNVTAVSFIGDTALAIGNKESVSLLHLSNLTFERLGALEGLPYTNITALTSPREDVLWIASEWGVSRLNISNMEWRYYNGPRYFPSLKYAGGSPPPPVQTNASFIASLSDSDVETVVVASTHGVATISMTPFTLESKAKVLQDQVYPVHDRLGYTAGVSLKEWGNISTYVQGPGESDGLWTSIYLASQAFRYAVTKDPDAKTNADNAFAALKFLVNVTGIPGLPSRCVCKVGEHPPAKNWVNSTAVPGWMYQDGASSDDITGHLFAYPIYYDLVAESDAEKASAKQMIQDITQYIVANNFYLIDVTGKPTQWGVWNPKQLNGDPSWASERGVNSMQILGYLQSAYRITGNATFQNAIDYLVKEHQYDFNLLNAKVTVPDNDNFSDDELLWMAYYVYFTGQAKTPIPTLATSMKRSHGIIRNAKLALWNVMYGAYQNEDWDGDDAVFCLQTWVLSHIDWPAQNSQRKNIRISPDLSRSNAKQSTNVMRYNEGLMLRWNGDPFNLDGGTGSAAQDPGAWLCAYWMARYHNLILAP